MARTLKVRLTAPSPDLIHQWRNFGEGVWRELREQCEVSIDEIDASNIEFFVRGIHKRELRAIAARVRKIAEKNLMSQVISVTEITDDHDA